MKKIREQIAAFMAALMIFGLVPVSPWSLPANADGVTATGSNITDPVTVKQKDPEARESGSEEVKKTTPSDTSESTGKSSEADSTETAEKAEAAAPVFMKSTIVDGVRITVTAPEGVFPEDARLKARKVSLRKVDEAVESLKDETEDAGAEAAEQYTFDIKMLDASGAEIEPDLYYGDVSVSFEIADCPEEYGDVSVYHVKSEGGDLTAEKLDTEVTSDADGKVTATVDTDGFSYYVVKFIVPSTQNSQAQQYSYTLYGDEVKLSEIFIHAPVPSSYNGALNVTVPYQWKDYLSISYNGESYDWTIKVLKAIPANNEVFFTVTFKHNPDLNIYLSTSETAKVVASGSNISLSGDFTSGTSNWKGTLTPADHYTYPDSVTVGLIAVSEDGVEVEPSLISSNKSDGPWYSYNSSTGEIVIYSIAEIPGKVIVSGDAVWNNDEKAIADPVDLDKNVLGPVADDDDPAIFNPDISIKSAVISDTSLVYTQTTRADSTLVSGGQGAAIQSAGTFDLLSGSSLFSSAINLYSGDSPAIAYGSSIWDSDNMNNYDMTLPGISNPEPVQNQTANNSNSGNSIALGSSGNATEASFVLSSGSRVILMNNANIREVNINTDAKLVTAGSDNLTVYSNSSTAQTQTANGWGIASGQPAASDTSVHVSQAAEALTNVTLTNAAGRSVFKPEVATVYTGSTILAFHKDFMESLDPGVYDLRMYYGEKYVGMEMTVNGAGPVYSDGSENSGYRAPVKETGGFFSGSGNEWMFIKRDASAAKNEWISFNGRIYYIGPEGKMLTGLVKDQEGHSYFLSMNHDGHYGAAMSGFVKDGSGKVYYFDPATYQMVTGEMMINHAKHTFASDGHEISQ